MHNANNALKHAKEDDLKSLANRAADPDTEQLDST